MLLLPSAAVALAGVASAASCSCSVGGAGASLPTGSAPTAGRVQVSASGGVRQTGGAASWEGAVPAVDRHGDSMPAMAMPGHREHSLRAGLLVGLGRGFSAAAALPWTYDVPLGESDMPGDVARGLLGDLALTGRWGRRRDDTTVGASLGGTLPTGRVARGVGVRGGRGVAGLDLGLEALRLVAPVVGLGGRGSVAASLYGAPDGYTVGPDAELVAGARVWTREQGRLSFTADVSALHRGHDRSGGTALADTGADVLRVGGGLDLLVPARAGELGITLGARAPLLQAVGDPWLAENGTLTAGVSAAW